MGIRRLKNDAKSILLNMMVTTQWGPAKETNNRLLFKI